MSATDARRRGWSSWSPGSLLLATLLLVPSGAGAQTPAEAPPPAAGDATHLPVEREPAARGALGRAARFVGGGVAGLLAHEGGHLFFNVVFDAEPALRRVELAGVPFFAITHRADLSPRREYAVSAAGFWVQQGLAEWILTAQPDVRRQDRPAIKGVLAWHVLSSAAYFGVAMARAGPLERDTRGMAMSLGISERWVGALVLVPAVCDAWRYVEPHAPWPRWVSRAAKLGLILAIVGAGG